MNSPFIQSILHAANLIGNFSQAMTNGPSVLGTLKAPYLPQYLSNTSTASAPNPWSSTAVSTVNPYEAPNTGIVRSYHFNIARGYLSPDGVNRSMLLINGQFPGPTIQANWGDTINVTVSNQITGPEEGTSMHWHGLLQKASPWMDGSPAVQQCPIAPGKSFTYSFRADSYGTTWYHSHYSAQYSGGIFGPLVIYGPSSAPYDVDVGPILLSDWDHPDYFQLVQAALGPYGSTPVSENNLINGKGVFNCSTLSEDSNLPDETSCSSFAGLAKFNFQSGKVHRLRLINAGSDGIQKFTLDGYSMTVIANDFVPVQPYSTNVVTLGVGQRTDVLVTAKNITNSSFWMRSEITTQCSQSTQPVALAAVYYPKTNTSSTPTTNATSYTVTGCGNDDLSSTIPMYTMSAIEAPAATQTFSVSQTTNSTGHTQWLMNNVAYDGNFNYPVYLLARAGNYSYPADPQWSVYNFGSNASILIVLVNYGSNPHPFHLHGHNFQVLNEGGSGVYEPGDIIRPSNPQRRDTQILQPYSYVAMAFAADNPGVWPLHCHIAWHVSAGLFVNIMENPRAIHNKSLPVPSSMAQTCREWWTYTNSSVVNQIDSGL